MDLDHIGRVPEMISHAVPDGSTVLLQWHGGEPTLMGPDFIREGIKRINNAKPKYTWKHGIQTNLMTFDERWAELYHEKFGSEVGISWDPEIRLLNQRSPKSHPEFNKRFEEKLRLLISSGLTPYLVVTAAKTLFEAFPNPFDFFEKWKSFGVNHVHLERITQTGYARDNWVEVGLSNREYSSYMTKWLKAYALFKRSGLNKEFFLSPFEDMTESIRSLEEDAPRGLGCWSGKCDTRFHTVDGDGYKAGCTALTSETGNKNAKSAPVISNNLSKKRELRTFNCTDCKFRQVCSTGCLALSFDDGSGECSGGYNLFKAAHAILEKKGL
jgi:radical SAM protein with 4Fe4S-binding SPASM domain